MESISELIIEGYTKEERKAADKANKFVAKVRGTDNTSFRDRLSTARVVAYGRNVDKNPDKAKKYYDKDIKETTPEDHKLARNLTPKQGKEALQHINNLQNAAQKESALLDIEFK